MKEMTELKMVYELVISRANPLDNPRYELLNQAQRKMKDAILNVIRQTNPNYPEMDYDDDVFKYIVEFNDEYCIDSFVLATTKLMIPAVLVGTYALLSIRADGTTMLDFIKYGIKFFISTQQYYEWGLKDETLPKQNKTKVGDENGKKEK